MHKNPDAALFSASNPFAKILTGEIPCNTVYENDKVLVFEDVAPKAPVHLLIIPKVMGLVNLQSMPSDHLDVLIDIAKAAKEVATQLNLRGYRLVTNSGYFGGQRVPHLHFHLLSGDQAPLCENII